MRSCQRSCARRPAKAAAPPAQPPTPARCGPRARPRVRGGRPAVLRKARGEVSVATEATREAGLMRAAGSVPPDLVLLDLGLPGRAGIDALTRLRAQVPG